MLKILIMVGEGFADSEFIYPFYRLQEEGYEVDIVASQARETYCGKCGVAIQSDISPEDVDTDDYMALIIPGGIAPDKMRCDDGLVNVVKEFNKKEKMVAAICHGPQMLIEADVLNGKNATCHRSVRTDLKNAGAIFVDEPVVVDGKLVTARASGDLPNFCKELIRLLKV